MNITEEKIVGELVASDYRTASVFKKFGIDFCCNGNRTIKSASEQKKINAGDVLAELKSVMQSQAEPFTDYKSWPADLLADYIEKKHHRYVQEKTTEIMPYLDRVCKVHGNSHPELHEIHAEFSAVAGELAMHMKKEELILFPYIRQMVKADRQGVKAPVAVFGKVSAPIQTMMQEHDTEGNRFKKIEELTSGFTPPQDACNTYRVTYALLKEFEDDLHTHIHLENNILFPEAVRLEKAVC